MRIIDSHAHYDDRAFDEDRYELLDMLMKGDVKKIVNVGCSVKSSHTSCALAERYENIWFSAGLHPDSAEEIDRLAEIEELCSHEKCVAIGEIGLDYHYEEPERSIQKAAFEEQLKLAKRLDMPVIIHSREACEDTLELLRRYSPRGVMHCYSYSAETVREVMQLGMYIGFTGALTFKNAKKNRRALEAVPRDRLLVETDCPYMAPEPNRGKRSHSGMIADTLTVFAEIMGISVEEAADITARNAETLFGI